MTFRRGIVHSLSRGLVRPLARGLVSASGGGAAPAFDPASLFTGGYAGGAWAISAEYLRQLSGGTGSVSDGFPVGYVEDLSGNGNHLIQATSGKRPTYTDSSPIKYLSFDGVDDTLAASLDFSADNKCTIVVAWCTLDFGSVRAPLYWGYGSGVNGTWGVQTQAFGADQVLAKVWSNSQDGVETLAPSDRNTRHVDSVVIDLSQAVEADKVVAVRDGTTAWVYSASGALGTGNLASARNLTLCDNSIGTGFSTAEFSALLVIGRVLTTEELAQARTWAGAYAGITI